MTPYEQERTVRMVVAVYVAAWVTTVLMLCTRWGVPW